MTVVYNEDNPYIPDPVLVADMAATVKIHCPYGEYTSTVWRWLNNNGIDFRFRNQWTDSKGQFASFTIVNEQQRMMFLLRWA